MLGQSVGGGLLDELGKNKSSDAVDVANESTFAQAHACCRSWSGSVPRRLRHWWSEFDPPWQSDELAALLTPEAALFANKAMVLACTADAVAANTGWPLDAMPCAWGSGGLAYPMTGHVDNDNIVQANATAAYWMLYKLNRIGLIHDPAPECGCAYTPVWVKSQYKMNCPAVHPRGAPHRPGHRDLGRRRQPAVHGRTWPEQMSSSGSSTGDSDAAPAASSWWSWPC